MASIKLKHSGGNGVIIAAPTSNPASDKTLTLPSDVDGTVVSKDSSNSLQNIAGINGGQLGNRNLIINGAMQVAQRGTSSTSTGYQTVDRFTVLSGGTDETPTQAQVDLTSSDTPYSYGFRKALKITNGNQTGGAGANDYIEILQKFEGQDINTSGWDFTSTSSFITISFWIKSSVAQTFYGGFRITEASANKQYTFAINATTSWQKITKTISGASGLNPVNTNGVGGWFDLIPFYGTGLTGSMTLDQWNTVDTSAYVPDMTSTWYTTNDATLEYTGLQMEVGDTATDFEHRSFGQELQLCKRYYQQYVNIAAVGNVPDNGSRSYSHALMFPVEMRAAPTITISNTGSSGGQRVSDADNNVYVSSLLSTGVQPTGATISFYLTGDLTNYRGAYLTNTASTDYQTTYKIDAEL